MRGSDIGVVAGRFSDFLALSALLMTAEAL
jgi:hypothetical protein